MARAKKEKATAPKKILRANSISFKDLQKTVRQDGLFFEGERRARMDLSPVGGFYRKGGSLSNNRQSPIIN
ncbi:MAG: hypothetical protein CMI29_10795 [Opitutae bacterium]|nr:hypothetical protein [Opitutae bacterium]